MKRHQESHLDHGLTEGQVSWLFEHFKDRQAFFVETVEMPTSLGKLPCGLWGPAMGDREIDGFPMFLPPGEYIIPSGIIGEFEDDERGARWSLVGGLDRNIMMGKRGARDWESRLINAPMRPTRFVTVIAGPHEEHECILYTCYGGPEAPQEPTDPNLPAGKREMSEAFWKVHALSRYAS